MCWSEKGHIPIVTFKLHRGGFKFSCGLQTTGRGMAWGSQSASVNVN